MASVFGYAGKILTVDLSLGRTTEIPTEKYTDRFIGGRGIAASIYWDKMSEFHALDPENPLIFMTGPLAGFPGLSGSRWVICGKSPASSPEHFFQANLGGSWGAWLKFTGKMKQDRALLEKCINVINKNICRIVCIPNTHNRGKLEVQRKVFLCW